MQIPDRNSEEGQQLAPQVYEDVDAALHISSVPYGAVPEAGSQCNNPNISNALAIIDGMVDRTCRPGEVGLCGKF